MHIELVDEEQQKVSEQGQEAGVLTVEAALAELGLMFPDKWFELTVSRNIGRLWYWVRVYGKPRQGSGCATLEEAMDLVRKWKQSQDKESK